MDEFDRRIIDLIQTKFPVDARPYRAIGETVGLEEGEVIRRIQKLKQDNIIRRVGALVNPRKVGYISSLVAARVDEEKIGAVTEKINGYLGVTHNYYRPSEFNVWFTLIAKNPETHQRILGEIEALEGVEALHNLPATKIYKLKVDFKAGEDEDDD